MRILLAALAVGLVALLAWITLSDSRPEETLPERSRSAERGPAVPVPSVVDPEAAPEPSAAPVHPAPPTDVGEAVPAEQKRAVVRGRVLDADGNAVAGAIVQPAGPFTPTEEQPRPVWCETDAAGNFAIALPPVATVLTVVGAGIRAPKDGVEVTPPAEKIVIRVERGRVALGRVIAEADGKPVAGATVRLTFFRGGWSQTKASASGWFAFDLSESDYDAPDLRLTVLVTSAGFKDAEIANLALEDVAPASEFVVKLVRDLLVESGRLKGRVLYDTGDPFYGSLTLSFSAEGKAGEIFRILTNEKGEFVVPKVAAGEYVLRSAPHGESILRETGKTLVIPPGGEETTEFTLTRGGDVNLEVTGPGGAVVKDVSVAVLDEEGAVHRSFVIPGGAARIPDLAPGKIQFRISKKGYVTRETEVTVVKDQATDAAVQLEESR